MTDLNWSEIYANDWDDEQIEVVEHQKTIDSWKWGTVEQVIIKVKEPEEYFRIQFRVSVQGETNELRDDEGYDIEKVIPFEKTITTWKAVN